MRKHSLRLLPSAKNDIREARKWYRQINDELPERFKKELMLISEALKLQPAVHAVRYRNVRLAHFYSFPYAIHYFINERLFTINIIAVQYTARNSSL